LCLSGSGSGVRWTAKKGRPLVRLSDQQKAQLAELQRTNALLDRIAAALERRAGS
jgi:hypothetical protein